MANETKRPESPNDDEAKTEQTTESKSKFSLFRGKSAQYWLAILLISTIVLHGIGLAYFKLTNTCNPVEYSPEITLGNYEFKADKTAGGRIVGAEFSVYITALEGLDSIARTKLASHKYRVQEEIESLMRQAHSGDFEDTTLSDLKRQIREQTNHALGNRVVSDVIIADLKITPLDNKQPASAAAETSPPWLEKSSSYISQQGGN